MNIKYFGTYISCQEMSVIKRFKYPYFPNLLLYVNNIKYKGTFEFGIIIVIQYNLY